MRRRSHIVMGQFLLETYLSELSPGKRRLFLLGCTEPDKNPTTYLKGSLRCRWLRGHDYSNARRFMVRLALRLDGKQELGPWDCYSLGKLMHYTLDAFTFAHNERFSGGLWEHRLYERELQRHFLARFGRLIPPKGESLESPDVLLHSLHRDYMQYSGSPETDTDFAFRACYLLMQKLIRDAGPKQR